jgi:hypothetical protein
MADLNQGASIEAERVRRTPAAAPGAGELPPLPKPDVRSHLDVGAGFGPSAYSAAKVRHIVDAAIAADRAQQAGAAAPITYTVDGVTMSPLEYIAYLHDQLAAAQQAKEYEQRHAAESETALAKAHAQLAAKGQGFEQWWADQVKANGDVPIGADYRHWAEKGYLAAPARAQPADGTPLAELWIHEDMDRDAMEAALNSPRKELKDAHRKAVNDLIYWKRRALTAEAGAQPDQRESAAEGGCTQPMLEAAMKVAVASGLIAKYADGESYLRNWDGMKACVNAALAAAPTSPAAKPAKEGEQLTNNKGESNGQV